jgi:hypothetical protein
MNTVELTKYAFGNAFDILSQVTADLTPEQADWTPPGIANPIGATYWHTVSGADEVVCKWIRGQEPLHLAYMRAIRVDVPALHEYARAVTETIREWLASLAPEDLEREMETPIGKLSVGQVVETFVIWHVNAHCGEISALKGCQGARGYPF